MFLGIAELALGASNPFHFLTVLIFQTGVQRNAQCLVVRPLGLAGSNFALITIHPDVLLSNRRRYLSDPPLLTGMM